MIVVRHKTTGQVLRLVEADSLRGAKLRDADLSGADLSDADLSSADLFGANLFGAKLRGAKLRGADLSSADLFGANLSSADLFGANLFGANLRGANLRGAKLRDADLNSANLRDADLSSADLSDADLFGANFSEANLSGAKLPSGIPVIERIHERVYEAASRPDALDMRDWHTCATTHCRAGWVVTLAGQAGAELEKRLGTGTAAALIYQASDPNLDCVPDWIASNEAALDDMRRLAGVNAG